MTPSFPQADGVQPSPAPDQPKVASLEEAIQFFAALLLAVLRNALIYSPKHALFQRALTRAEQMAGIAFGFVPEIVFICLEKELFFAGKPMNKRGAQFQRLAEFMHSLGVHRLQVLPGLAAEELKVFALNLVGLTEAGESTGGKRIQATRHIRVGRLSNPEAGGGSLSLDARARGVASREASVSSPGGALGPTPGVNEAPDDRREQKAGPAESSVAGSHADADRRTDAKVAEAILQGASREMAACERTLQLVAGLAKHAGYLAVLAPLSKHHAPTYLHSINVALLAAAHVQALQAPSDLLRDILLAGLFHDLGKLAVPAQILGKPEARTAAEERLYQQHCVAGAELLSQHRAIPPSAVMAAFEHHLYAGGDGGFPQAHRSGKPHMISQMVALSDFYDHARSGTPGQPPRTLEAILDEIRRETPTRFHPSLTARFPKALQAFEPLSGR